VAAAVEANARGVPLLSPAATAEDIHAIGEWVFQNRISSEAQAVALARVAIAELLGARLAVLYPKQGGGEQLARLFEETIDALGGEIVASVAYEVGATDFGDVLDELRIAQPELLFVPGEVEPLVLLVPQLAYHGIDAQLLGNDAWNSRRLARQGGAGLEGAVFPSDLLLRRDRELYADFQRLYEARFESGVSPVAARGFLGAMLLLEILGEGNAAPAAIRDALAERTATRGDERSRREALAAQVTLMTMRGGEIEAYAPGSRWRPAASSPSVGFIDEP
jgi:branched-chain amino acid transport system substrate-binding protein